MKKIVENKEIELFQLAMQYLINEGIDCDMKKIQYVAIDKKKRVVEFAFFDKSVVDPDDIESHLIYITDNSNYIVTLSENEVIIRGKSTSKYEDFFEDQFGREIVIPKDFFDRNVDTYFRRLNDHLLVKGSTVSESVYDGDFNLKKTTTNSYTNDYQLNDNLNLMDGYPAKEMGKSLIKQ